jgi:hypothetical protein
MRALRAASSSLMLERKVSLRMEEDEAVDTDEENVVGELEATDMSDEIVLFNAAAGEAVATTGCWSSC